MRHKGFALPRIWFESKDHFVGAKLPYAPAEGTFSHPLLAWVQVWAQATQSNLLTQHTIIEQVLGELSMPITFPRPGWFMENCSWDVASATNDGVISSFLQPIDKPVPMVATADVARLAAELLQETWKGRSVVELEGPRRVTPNEIATTFSDLLGRPVRVEPVPRESWEPLFKSHGMKNPAPRIEMLDGFNEGWIEFENGEASSRKGEVTLKTVLQMIIERERKRPHVEGECLAGAVAGLIRL